MAFPLSKIFSNLRNVQSLVSHPQILCSNFLSTFSSRPIDSTAGGAWSLIPVRTNIRNNWPRPKETKRITIHGWLKRMSTVRGRRVLMRRILKGRHVLSH